MRHWKKQSAVFAVGALALALPFAAGASKRPPSKAQAQPLVVAPTVATVARSPFGPKLLASAATSEACSSGAHTLSHFGDRVYPEMGNGGYTSLHSDVYLNYEALTNLFLSGTRADLTVRSTQCLSDLSFDFERTNTSTAGGSGPNMTVNSVEVNGAPAAFAFVQPTYPGDPNGQNDPDPAAHAASTLNPVSATNPNPPACNPETNAANQVGTPCPADKLVVTPSAPIPSGTTFTVTVDYTGRPGVHVDPDNSTEGWFRVATAGNEGAFVTTEPVGNDAWMPLNNHPLGKPTYDIYDTTNVGKTAVGPGELVGFTPPVSAAPTYTAATPTSVNPPDANFPGGSWTWHWHSPEPIANYLVENSVGAYDLIGRTSPASGVQYWEAQASSILATKKATNKTAMDNQEDIVNFQTTFNGPWPLTTDGIVVGTPSASFEEEMQGKITFAGGSIGPNLGTFNHENMHQWFGDNVAEGAFNLTFWKEGFATLGEYLNTARGTPPGVTGGPAFEASLVGRFNGTGNYNSNSLWTSASSNPTAANLFSTANTYTRPGTAYVALWETLTRDGMIAAMKEIQSTYGGKNITEPQLEEVFRSHLPVKSASCNARLTTFFTQWWDTSYPTGGGLNKPQLTGPGLNGPGFPCAAVTPSSPNGANGWYTSPVSLAWSGFPSPTAPQTATKNGCVDETLSTDGTYSKSCGVTVKTAPTLSAAAAAAATNVKVSSVLGLGVNQPITIDSTGANPQTVTTTAVGTAGATGSGVTFTPALASAHASGATIDALIGNSGLVSETFKVDATAPATVGTIAPASPDGQNGWYLSPPTVTLQPSDATSGLASTQYSLDGGPWTAYSGPISPSGEGGHSLQFYSVDNAGNQEAPQTITWAVDTSAPTTTAKLTPGIRNGWYANPALSFTVNDGRGSGDITDPCPPRVLCGFSTVFSVDGGPFHAYEDPAHFGTGNHFVQYRTTDDAGRVEATRLIAFKVDAVKPSVNITTPPDGTTYPLDKVTTAKFRCTDRESGLDTCVGTVANGANLDTHAVGDHAFTVTGTDKAGNVTVVTHHYQVVYTWNGFFAPVTNSGDGLNLVHAGDLVKIGFGLNGDRGLNVFAATFPTSVPITCPSGTPHSVPAGGAGTTPGLSYGVASGHYTYGWQTSTGWAGTCRRFEARLNDGTSTLHTADFMFFA